MALREAMRRAGPALLEPWAKLAIETPEDHVGSVLGELAVRRARVLGLEVAGVDLLRSKRGPLVLEVNSSPGLEGIEGATGLDVAGSIIDYIDARTRRARSQRSGRSG